MMSKEQLERLEQLGEMVKHKPAGHPTKDELLEYVQLIRLRSATFSSQDLATRKPRAKVAGKPTVSMADLMKQIEGLG